MKRIVALISVTLALVSLARSSMFIGQAAGDHPRQTTSSSVLSPSVNLSVFPTRKILPGERDTFTLVDRTAGEDFASNSIFASVSSLSLSLLASGPTTTAATFTVTNTNESGPGSLRQAILDANGSAGSDLISFNITTGCDVTTNVCTITPTFVSPLPAIVDPVTIDGYTQPGASANTLIAGNNAVLLIEISGAIVTNNASGLSIRTGGAGSIVRGLVINGGFLAGIQILDSSNNLIGGCFLGTDAAGLGAQGNTIGVLLDSVGNSTPNAIGGTTPAARNLIAGNGTGVSIQGGTNNLVQGNFIGTNKTGTSAIANSIGVNVVTDGNLIGGPTVAARNVIAGNGGAGVVINSNGNPTSGNRIQGNFIGTDVTGTTPLGFSDGIRLSFNTSDTRIGDPSTTPGLPPGNVISGNGTGILIGNNVSNNNIKGNLIGTDASGTIALGNSLDGISIRGSSNVVGGSEPNATNVISANGGHGVSIGSNNATVQDNTVQSNFIGTDVTGSNSLGNARSGVMVLDAFSNSISANSIAFNVGLGIDLNNDGVTPNDNCDGDAANSNNLQNYPVITDVHSASGNTTVTGTLNSAANTTFRIEFFTNSSCDPSGKGEGKTSIGSTTVTTDASCNASFSVPVTPEVPGGQFITATATDPANNTSEFSNCRFVISPTAANGIITGRIVDQSGHAVEGAVVRLSGTQNRKFITAANGVYRFDNVETTGFYTVTPSRVNYRFSPTTRSFSQLGETTEAAFGATLSTSGFVNPLDTPEYFVRQHYIDFLGREPDEAGFNFWSDQILGCGGDQECISLKRENVSAAYFISIEFQKTGGLVDRLYRASYGRQSQFAEFMPDTRAVGLGVQVGKVGWEALLAANEEAFLNAFVNRPAFHAAYDGMDHSLFVDRLISHTDVSFTAGERDALVSGLANGTRTRADVLRSIAEDNRFVNAKFNEAFVMMEYFGYLRRDPDASGFAFWLNKLNQFNGNFQQAEMVKAFIVSGEYRARFLR